MKRFLITISAAALLLAATSASAGRITGSAHDFSTTGWGGGEICLACHAAHNNQNSPGEMLWNHDLSLVTDYGLYTSPTFSAAPGVQPDGSSKLCLSCHDGTVALDSYGGGAGAEGPIDSFYNFGTDLSDDHPISFTYTVEPGLWDPAATSVTIGEGVDALTGNISDMMLYGGTVQCSSCHDVHNTQAIDSTPLLLVDNAGSDLCLTCHDK
jgi:predicted CXXCH cytochrome family protein